MLLNPKPVLVGDFHSVFVIMGVPVEDTLIDSSQLRVLFEVHLRLLIFIPVAVSAVSIEISLRCLIQTLQELLVLHILLLLLSLILII